MSRQNLTDAEVVNLIKEAQKQLDEYLQLAQLSAEVTAPEPLKSLHGYSWDSPLGLVVGETAVDGFVVTASG